jgi:hypothetical protein
MKERQMERTTEIVIEAKLHLNRGWQLTRIDYAADGVEIDRSEAEHGLFPSSAEARRWYDTDERLAYLRGRGIAMQFTVVREPF